MSPASHVASTTPTVAAPAIPTPAVAASTGEAPASTDLRALRDDVAGPGPEGHDARGARLDVVPDPTARARPRRGRQRLAASLAGTCAVHLGFAGLLVLLVDWRDLRQRPELAIPVEIVSRVPEPARPAPAAPAAPVPQPSPPPPPPEAQLPGAAAAAPPPNLVAPPPEAAPAQATETASAKPNTATAAASSPDPPPPATPVAVPKVVTARDGGFTVPRPEPPRPTPAPSPKPTPPAAKPDPAAELAAALPMNTATLPASFRAVLSGGGAAASEEYRGVVYGRLGRSHEAVERARTAGLRGQVMVSFTIGADGAATDLAVAQSSGSAALDALALDMVREAAPFPPPPPGARRTFSPVLTFGDG